MPRNEDGEFELVLGNKQLLTVFFIVVVLLGIFATMGYIVGRSTVPPAPADSRKETASKQPPVVDPRAPAESSTETPAAKPPALGAGEVSIGGPDKPTQTAAQQAPSPAPAAGGKPAPEPKAVKQEPPPPKPEPKKQAAPTGGPLFLEPSAGQTFLQVLAVAKADSEIAVNTLRKKGFPAYIAPGPAGQDKLYRVLVGPFENAAAITESRTKLKEVGFENPIIRKY